MSARDGGGRVAGRRSVPGGVKSRCGPMRHSIPVARARGSPRAPRGEPGAGRARGATRAAGVSPRGRRHYAVSGAAASVPCPQAEGPMRQPRIAVSIVLLATLLVWGCKRGETAASPPPGSPPSPRRLWRPWRPPLPRLRPRPTTPSRSSRSTRCVAPIALYPDALLAQVLMASTYPLEMVQAARWTKRTRASRATRWRRRSEEQTWDPSVQSLVLLPRRARAHERQPRLDAGSRRRLPRRSRRTSSPRCRRCDATTPTRPATSSLRRSSGSKRRTAWWRSSLPTRRRSTCRATTPRRCTARPSRPRRTTTRASTRLRWRRPPRPAATS